MSNSNNSKTPAAATPPSSAAPPNSASASSAASTTSSASPTPNVASCCPREKWQYEKCFQHWYNDEYLTGKSRDLSACQPLFDTYRACVLTHYEKNEPEFLLAAQESANAMLTGQGHQSFPITKMTKANASTMTTEKKK